MFGTVPWACQRITLMPMSRSTPSALDDFLADERGSIGVVLERAREFQAHGRADETVSLNIVALFFSGSTVEVFHQGTDESWTLSVAEFIEILERHAPNE